MERDCLQEDSPVFGDWKKDYLDLSGTPACVHDDLLDFVSLIFLFQKTIVDLRRNGGLSAFWKK